LFAVPLSGGEKPDRLKAELQTYALHFYTCSCKYEITMTPTKSDLPQGTLDLLILKVIALGPVHGYAIAQRLQQVSRGVVQVPQGSLYPALHRLENRGLLAADWKQTETGREAKFYRLTRKGRAQLETEAVSWQRLTEAIGLILRMSEGGVE
jgi:PadR family transcriptional regulator